jgi:thiosulfate/3-mercaptopyruvate sulfurtransferase
VLKKDDFEETAGSHGIDEDSTVVFYGDGWIPNWFALFAYWEFKYYGHEDARVLDGGKDYWVDEGYPLTDEVPEFPAVDYHAGGPFEGIRAYQDDVDKARERGVPMVDVRSPEEFSGEVIAPEGLQETAQRGGHIPGASNVPVKQNLRDDGRFKGLDALDDLYADHGIDGDESVITYCRVGERSAIAWFALHELLGYDDVTNYDGSWTEWGNLVRAPIERGE